MNLDEQTGMSRQRRWQLKKAASGLCTICGKPKVSGDFCAVHLEANRKNSNRHARIKAGIPLDTPLKKTGRPRKW